MNMQRNVIRGEKPQMTGWPTKLLSVNGDAKTIKGKKYGYLSGVHYGAPAWESGYQTCPDASDGCTSECLFSSGRARQFATIKESRINKTLMFFEHRSAFMAMMCKEIDALIRKAKREDLIPCVRPNGTTDITFEKTKAGINLMRTFPEVQFYDYTKSRKRMMQFLAGNMPSNYHLTFSRTENNWTDCENVLLRGGNVAVVFATKNTDEFPETYMDYPVCNGDDSDLRFLDPEGLIGNIIGLTVKATDFDPTVTIDSMLMSGMAVPCHSG